MHCSSQHVSALGLHLHQHVCFLSSSGETKVLARAKCWNVFISWLLHCIKESTETYFCEEGQSVYLKSPINHWCNQEENSWHGTEDLCCFCSFLLGHTLKRLLLEHAHKSGFMQSFPSSLCDDDQGCCRFDYNNLDVPSGEQGDCLGSEVCAADLQERSEKWVNCFYFAHVFPCLGLCPNMMLTNKQE